MSIRDEQWRRGSLRWSHDVLVMAASKRIAFVSTMEVARWGGSEELWSRTALELASQGFPISASVIGWLPLHPRVTELQRRGVALALRPRWYSLKRHPWRWLTSRGAGPEVREVRKLLTARPNALVVLSSGNIFPPIALLELCASRRVAFVAIGHGNSEGDPFDDARAERYRAVLPSALRCFFVSEGNWRLAEKQIGGRIDNAEVVRNPFNISYDAAPAWPGPGEPGEIRFASVGALWWPTKGQDLLLEALAGAAWKNRRWKLTFYGDGASRGVLQSLAERLGLSDRASFAGFVPVEEIWANNHVLVMPSRHEGLPLAVVEAMLCGRPVIATDVGGHGEVIEDGVTGFLAEAPTAAAVASALERFWERKDEAEQIGKNGARRIRELVPRDPAHVFAERLKELAGLRGA